MVNLPAALADYRRILNACCLFLPESSRPLEFTIVETGRLRTGESDYYINALFQHDLVPLSPPELALVKAQLEVNRNELLALLDSLPPDLWDLFIPNEVRQSIRGILRHVATAEWWYLDRLDLAPSRDRIPEDTIAGLRFVRECFVSTLPIFSENSKMTVKREERWTPRKVIRRALWHERVHTLQIHRYAEGLVGRNG